MSARLFSWRRHLGETPPLIAAVSSSCAQWSMATRYGTFLCQSTYSRHCFPNGPPGICVRGSKLSRRPPESEVILDGLTLSAEAIAALPLADKAVIEARLSSELLHALLECFAERWSGGFRVLFRTVVTLMDDGIGCSLYKLNAALVLAKGGQPTRFYISYRTEYAEALEAAKRYKEAAGVYSDNIRLQALPLSAFPAPSLSLFIRGCPMKQHSYLYCALETLGDQAGAAAALEAGLHMIETFKDSEDDQRVVVLGKEHAAAIRSDCCRAKGGLGKRPRCSPKGALPPHIDAVGSQKGL